MNQSTALSDAWGKVLALWVLSISHPITALFIKQRKHLLRWKPC